MGGGWQQMGRRGTGEGGGGEQVSRDRQQGKRMGKRRTIFPHFSDKDRSVRGFPQACPGYSEK